MLTSLDAVRDLLKDMSEPNTWIADAIGQRERQLIKPLGSLGRLEELTRWYGSWRGTKLNKAHVIVFAGNHGVVAQGVSAWAPDVTSAMVYSLRRGRAAINQLATSVGATLEIVPVADLRATRDMTAAPAMTDVELLAAINEGYRAVSPTIDIVVFGEMGIGNTTSASAISALLFGGPVRSWVGRGAGIDDVGLGRKINAVERACAMHRGGVQDPLDVMRCVGGFELAAIMGATLAARQFRIPVILDGFVATGAVAPLHVINSHALDHCLMGHVSAEPGHCRLAQNLGLERPLIDLGLRLGEGSGAVLAIPILKAAVACHAGMATFAEIGILEQSA